ncbi:glycosyltransferase [Phyllobacterium sp. P30BS-XVII]|uniref:glycosyltransferase n=1 Tax=Phyllobacterium sp. P30BS-XVII TaxID=2587046 RepID=UPI000DD97D5C|nr:glycosyltransferase [Phyllobacterium sp. P30BS-XVII]MBA8901960.1 lipopolysaccharide biosynthesis glycosyltransferase [Phyllobacterium sp. P30BS-XVII]
MTEQLDIYVGWDSREPIAYEVAKSTILKHASIPVGVEPIVLENLVSRNAYTRDIDPLASTEFTYSRFFTPWLADYKGWALFCDCDFLFFSDVADLLQYRDPQKAVYCVKHDYTPKEGTKMDGKVQTSYPRKNWSSFMLFNCEHPSVRKLTPELINRESGAYLHRMQWAADDEIGEIPTAWNWLEGWNEKPATGTPNAVHFTNGGPWFKDWQDVEYGDVWRKEALKIDPDFKPI